MKLEIDWAGMHKAALRSMTNSKRPMSERHGPHVQNKTPHEEINPIAAWRNEKP